jgi:hypothetical protein
MTQDTLRGSRNLNDELYPRVIAGDQEARQLMITSNYGLVVTKAESFLETFPKFTYLLDEFIGEGLLALVKAVDSMAGSVPESNTPINPTGYLGIAICRAIGNCADSQSIVSESARSKRHKRQNGIPIETPEVSDDLTDALTPEIGDPMALIDLEDTIFSCCHSDEERFIVRLRMEGLVDREIGDRLNLSTTTVFLLRKEIYARYLAKVQD